MRNYLTKKCHHVQLDSKLTTGLSEHLDFSPENCHKTEPKKSPKKHQLIYI